MNQDLKQAVESLESQYNILGKFYYSNYFTPTGQRDLHDWVKSCWQAEFQPLDRLLVIQDTSEVYEYDDLPGMVVVALQKTVANVDISNCFITVVTQNPNINQELSQVNKLYCGSPDPIQSFVASGEPMKPAEVLPQNTFCAVPWAHLYIGTDGNVLPCCAADPKFPLGNIEQDSIESIMNSSSARAMRQRMMTGRRTKECSACYAKEAQGLDSLRHMYNKKFSQDPVPVAEDGTVKNFKPLSLDIRLNKICNLKCRSCGPYYSSAIAQEFATIYGIESAESLDNKQRREALQEVLDYLPNVTSIYMGGGEPLLAPENYTIFNELVRINKTNVAIDINTNFTTFEHKGVDVFELLRRFDTVTIAASLDAYGQAASYVRHGTDWNIIENNLARVVAEKNIRLVITSTVGINNVESLIELQKTWHNQGLLDISHFKISQIVTNSEMSLQVLPAYHKERLAVIIRNHAIWCDRNDAHELSDGWLDVLKFMQAQDNSHLLSDFAKKTMTLDQHRGESFAEVFPQYADLLNYA